MMKSFYILNCAMDWKVSQNSQNSKNVSRNLRIVKKSFETNSNLKNFLETHPNLNFLKISRESRDLWSRESRDLWSREQCMIYIYIYFFFRDFVSIPNH